MGDTDNTRRKRGFACRADACVPHAEQLPDDPVERILYVNPIRRIWCVSYLIQCFADPTYSRIERQHGLSRLELVTLHCLALSGNLRAQQIVEMLVRPKNTVSGAVHSLLRKQLIVRQRDPQDGRRAILELTDTGRKLYETIFPTIVERERKFLMPLSAKELAELDRLLSKLLRNVPIWRFED